MPQANLTPDKWKAARTQCESLLKHVLELLKIRDEIDTKVQALQKKTDETTKGIKEAKPEDKQLIEKHIVDLKKKLEPVQKKLKAMDALRDKAKKLCASILGEKAPPNTVKCDAMRKDGKILLVALDDAGGFDKVSADAIAAAGKLADQYQVVRFHYK
jgi:seryl-tRNA synthetase